MMSDEVVRRPTEAAEGTMVRVCQSVEEEDVALVVTTRAAPVENAKWVLMVGRGERAEPTQLGHSVVARRVEVRWESSVMRQPREEGVRSVAKEMVRRNVMRFMWRSVIGGEVRNCVWNEGVILAARRSESSTERRELCEEVMRE